MDYIVIPWVQGLRVADVQDHAWQLVLFRRLAGQFDALRSGVRTRQIEATLGFRRSVYWYVGRTEPEFAFVAVTHDAPEDSGQDRAVAPFDTGGVATGKVITVPTLDLMDRRRLIHRESRPIDQYGAQFLTWVGRCFPGQRDYVSGFPPTEHVSANVPVTSPPNSAFAWTWEGRLPAVRYTGHPVPPREVFIAPGDAEAYRDWLRDEAPLVGDDDYQWHRDLALNIFREVVDPYGEMAATLEREAWS